MQYSLSKNYFMRNITNILICFGVSKLIAFVMQQNLFYKMRLSQKFKHNLLNKLLLGCL